MPVIPKCVSRFGVTELVTSVLARSYQGKVRDTFPLPNDKLLVLATDRLSIFDFVMPATVADKGHILTALTVHWFTKVLANTRNHLVAHGQDIEPYLPVNLRGLSDLKRQGLVVKRQEMLPIECIVRGYLTGSGWRSYQKNGTVCGIALPEGLHDGSKLPENLFTPSTKAETGHDENISFEQMVKIVGQETAEKLRQQSLDVFQQGSAYALERGVILADTKFEWGPGILADEVLTPDSSRFWDEDEWKQAAEKKESPPSHDKELVRKWGLGVNHPFVDRHAGINNLDPENPDHLDFVSQLKVPQDVLDQTNAIYHDIFERLTGQSLKNFTRDVMRVDVS
jgi:phosphoribosylaminoimidazole-succinocarboxamide synthase